MCIRDRRHLVWTHRTPGDGAHYRRVYEIGRGWSKFLTLCTFPVVFYSMKTIMFKSNTCRGLVLRCMYCTRSRSSPKAYQKLYWRTWVTQVIAQCTQWVYMSLTALAKRPIRVFCEIIAFWGAVSTPCKRFEHAVRTYLGRHGHSPDANKNSIILEILENFRKYLY